MRRHIIATDGGVAPGNPGPGTIAFVVRTYEDNRMVSETRHVEHIGDTTNNVAELYAIYSALHMPVYTENNRVEVITDSLNAYSWLTGAYRINEDRIRNLVRQIESIINRSGASVEWRHVRGHQTGTLDWEAKLNTACDDMIRSFRMEG
jgi:ribonuclease HI